MSQQQKSRRPWRREISPQPSTNAEKSPTPSTPRTGCLITLREMYVATLTRIRSILLDQNRGDYVYIGMKPYHRHFVDRIVKELGAKSDAGRSPSACEAFAFAALSHEARVDIEQLPVQSHD